VLFAGVPDVDSTRALHDLHPIADGAVDNDNPLDRHARALADLARAATTPAHAGAQEVRKRAAENGFWATATNPGLNSGQRDVACKMLTRLACNEFEYVFNTVRGALVGTDGSAHGLHLREREAGPDQLGPAPNDLADPESRHGARCLDERGALAVLLCVLSGAFAYVRVIVI